MVKFDSSIRKLIKNSGWLYGGGIFNTLLTTAQAILTARLLGLEGYGNLALILAAVGIVSQFADFRTWEVTIRFLPEKLASKEKDDATSFVRSLIWLDILSGLAAVAIIALINNWLTQGVTHNNQLAPLILLCSLSIPMTLVWNGTCTGVLRVFDRFDLITAKFMVISVIQLIAVVSVLWLGYGLVGVLVVFLLMETINAVISLALVGLVWNLKFSTLLNIDIRSVITNLGKIRGFLGQFWLSGTIKGIGGRIDILLLGALTSAAIVGTYRLALDIAGALTKIGNPIQTVILPIFVDVNSQDDSSKLRKLAGTTTFILSLVVVPAVIIISIIATGAVKTLVGPAYQEAGVPLIILSIGIGVNTIFIWSRPMLVAKSFVHIGNSIAILGTVIELLIIVLLARQYGAIAAALGTASMYIVVAVFTAIMGLNASPEKIGS
jgi:O-antigen/teichoic acid export membrane protein